MVLDINGIHYHVEVCGDGTLPLVLLHGFTGDASTWSPFLASWGKHFKLIVPDIIGHGKTEKPKEIHRYQIASAAHDLKDILDEMGVDKVNLLGYSMGGRLALTFTLLFPERVRRLVLESASPGLSSDKDRAPRRMKDAELAQFITEKGIRLFVDYWEEIPLFSSMKRLPSETKEIIRAQRLGNSAEGLANSLIGMGTGSQPSWWGVSLEQLNCEVLLLTGEEDKKFCGIAGDMLKELNNATWMVVENCGHAIHVEEPEKFGTIVSDFLIHN